jgi:hypothetical protein
MELSAEMLEGISLEEAAASAIQALAASRELHFRKVRRESMDE